MNKKIRKKIKAEILKKVIPQNGRPIAIFMDLLENVIHLAEEFNRNPNLKVNTSRVKIVNVNKLLKHNFRWFDSKGIIKNSEPFKVGDVGYINFVGTEEEDFPPMLVEMIAEYIGVELLEEPKGITIEVHLS